MIYLVFFICFLLIGLLWVILEFFFNKKYESHLSELSSKVRNLYIELHNYTFFHSPEGTKKTYNRYVGRKRLREKLKSILTNSETRSGAYLVTGFRGMGKTSLVRKAIAEIKGNHYYAISRHFRLFIACVVLYLFNSRMPVNLEKTWIIYSFGVASIFSIWYLCWHDNNRPNRWKYYDQKYIFHVYAWIAEVLISACRILDPEVDYYRRSKFKALLQDIVIITLMYGLFFVWKAQDLDKRAETLTLVMDLFAINLLYFLIIYVLNNYQIERQDDPEKKRWRNVSRAFIRIFSNAVKRLDYGNKVAIEISLSQDDLREIDILKLLAKNIYGEYRALRNRLFMPNRIVYPLLTFITIYLIIGILFYFKPIYIQINQFRHNSGIIHYLPSQALFPYVEELEFDFSDFDHDSINGTEVGNILDFVDSANAKMTTWYVDSLPQKKTRTPIYKPYYDDFTTLILKGRSIKASDFDQIFENGLPNGTSTKQDSIVLRESLLNTPISFKNAKIAIDSIFQVIPQIRPIQKSSFRHFMATVDFGIQTYYQRFFHDAIGMIGNKKIRAGYQRKTAFDFMFLPALLDYFFIFTIIVLLILAGIVRRNAWRFGLVNHNYVLRRLKFLNENLSAQIVQEQGRSVGVTGSGTLSQVFNFFSRRSRTYPVAGVREIENELIEILNDIDRIPSISTRPEFIFVFDELDKIEAQFNTNIQDKEKQELSSFTEEEGYFSTESIRRRQETIARILGNLKLFFNTARAKFIFIAGREMYDASLADISDRESFISSIFHEILYVDSFFKDAGSNGSNDITSTTEEFVCQLLMPRYARYPKNLKGYNEYLKHNFTRNNDLLRPIKKWINSVSSIRVFDLRFEEDKYQEKRRRKVIYVLGQFITFLTYRGNGAPKKITKLLEGFIQPVAEDHLGDPNVITYGRNSKNLYLYFDYTCQYRLGLTTHLFKPYLIANSVHIRDFGDKMLIATSFLMDHIYKYHKVGFSWENLELTPEIIAINKSPELRRFISRLIDFMASSHIEEIINGLHQFKFTIRIAAEIKYISTISEVEAAAFNFTLDESLLLKRHYRKKLRALERMYTKTRENASIEHQHINSIAYINTILADLHFYDREYDEALIHYENASQYLLVKEHKDLSTMDFIFLVRHMLKVGLTYEKTRDYDSAFISYGKVTHLIRDFSKKYETSEYFPDHEKVRIRRKLMENIRLIFEPLLAQFQVIEKGGPNGVTAEDIIRVQDEFRLVIKGLESEEKFLIETEFYNKVGDILYYKNGFVTSKGDGSKIKNGNKGYSLLEPEIKKERAYLLKPSSNFKDFKEDRDYKVPYSAWRLYARSATIFAHKIKNLESQEFVPYDIANTMSSSESIATLVKYLMGNFSFHGRSELKPNKISELLVAVGSNLSDMADTLICFLTENQKLDWGFLRRVLQKSMSFGREGVFSDQRVLKRLDEALVIDFDQQSAFNQIFIILFLSNQYFLRAGDYYRALFQLKKVLILIRRYLEFGANTQDRTIDEGEFDLVKVLLNEALEIADQSTKHTRRQQIHEWENILAAPNEEAQDLYQTYRDSLTQHPEGREIITICKEIQLHVRGLDKIKLLSENFLGTPYTVINNKFNRLFELYFKCSLNHQIMTMVTESVGCKNDFDLIEKNKGTLLLQLKKGVESSPELALLPFEEAEDLLRYLICDSIYGLMEVVRTFNVFGVTYIASHTSNALAHEHLGTWCNYFQRLKSEAESNLDTERFFNKLQSDLLEYVGEINSQYLDIGYHYKIAIQYYYSSLEVHNEGDAYKRAIEEMHYLDDDFDDNLSHFCAAIERYRINSGWVRKRIRRLKEQMEKVDKFSVSEVMEHY